MTTAFVRHSRLGRYYAGARGAKAPVHEVAEKHPRSLRSCEVPRPGRRAEAFTRSYALESGTFADDFHTFTLEWTAEGMRWLVDGDVYHVRTPEGLASVNQPWVYDHPFHLIVNLAIGGLFDGNPNRNTTFPQEMHVDYVRVFQVDGGE